MSTKISTEYAELWRYFPVLSYYTPPIADPNSRSASVSGRITNLSTYLLNVSPGRRDAGSTFGTIVRGNDTLPNSPPGESRAINCSLSGVDT